MENEGGSGSIGAHFEKRIYGNEIMTAKFVYPAPISKFTLQSMEDTGWYKVDLGYAGRYSWGHKNGCEFIENNDCNPKFNEFCEKEGKISCSTDYTSKAICAKDRFSDDCLINEY